MKIYTKTGDKGTTSLLGGTRVSKAHSSLEAYGTVDELNSSIGLIAVKSAEHVAFLQSIQNKLFTIGSLLALEKPVSFELPEIEEADVLKLEAEIDRMNEGLSPLTSFVLAGGCEESAHAHLARCICRRAERRVVVLENDQYTLIVQYLNRLSDYLFVLSRDLLRIAGKEDVLWTKD